MSRETANRETISPGACAASPSIEEINDILGRKLGFDEMTAWQSTQPQWMSADHLQRLVRLLGWHPTPTHAECRNDSGEFCCPRCGHTRLAHVAEGPCHYRDVNGFNSDDELDITDTFRACGSDGDWWLQCRHCVFEFNVPDGLEVAWH